MGRRTRRGSLVQFHARSWRLTTRESVDAVTAAGFEAMITRADHLSGTDRVAEVAHNLSAEIIVNVQGDEPLIDPETIDRAVNA